MTPDIAGISGPGTAFLAGLVTSLHCAGMCGPLACAVLPARERTDASTVASIYHLGRLSAYAVVGALAGGLGRLPLAWLGSGVVRWLPWLLVLFFLAVALRLDRRIPLVPGLGRAYLALSARARLGSPRRAAAVLGIATPLLPCGPLYLLVTLAALSGSALAGAEVLIAFGLGTVPVLWLAQVNFSWLRARLGPAWLGRAQVTLALAAAAVLAWRLRASLGLPGPDVNNFGCF